MHVGKQLLHVPRLGRLSSLEPRLRANISKRALVCTQTRHLRRRTSAATPRLAHLLVRLRVAEPIFSEESVKRSDESMLGLGLVVVRNVYTSSPKLFCAALLRLDPAIAALGEHAMATDDRQHWWREGCGKVFARWEAEEASHRGRSPATPRPSLSAGGGHLPASAHHRGNHKRIYT